MVKVVMGTTGWLLRRSRGLRATQDSMHLRTGRDGPEGLVLGAAEGEEGRPGIRA